MSPPQSCYIYPNVFSVGVTHRAWRGSKVLKNFYINYGRPLCSFSEKMWILSFQMTSFVRTVVFSWIRATNLSTRTSQVFRMSQPKCVSFWSETFIGKGQEEFANRISNYKRQTIQWGSKIWTPEYRIHSITGIFQFL
jgi:hypothetical protein